MVTKKDTCQSCNSLTEQLIQSYSSSLKMYSQFCKKYKQVASHIKNEETKRYFYRIDKYYFDDADKIKWNTLEPLISPNIESNVKRLYGGILNENEIRLCCLLFLGLSAKEISDILPFTQNSVHVISSRIKKKTGMKNIKESLRKESIFCI